jgi:hypothetical protein
MASVLINKYGGHGILGGIIGVLARCLESKHRTLQKVFPCFAISCDISPLDVAALHIFNAKPMQSFNLQDLERIQLFSLMAAR